jgi:hypothetical protein
MVLAKSNKILLLSSIFALLVSGCNRFYQSNDANTARNHVRIAIIPPSVSISAPQRMDAESLRQMQRTESANLQKELYGWLIRRKSTGRLNVDVADVLTTNAKLTRAGYFDNPIMTPMELCNMLQVDGIIVSSYILTKTANNNDNVGFGWVINLWGTPMEITANLAIHDKNTEPKIWNYNNRFTQKTYKSAGDFIEDMMSQAGRRLPYAR